MNWDRYFGLWSVTTGILVFSFQAGMELMRENTNEPLFTFYFLAAGVCQFLVVNIEGRK